MTDGIADHSVRNEEERDHRGRSHPLPEHERAERKPEKGPHADRHQRGNDDSRDITAPGIATLPVVIHGFSEAEFHDARELHTPCRRAATRVGEARSTGAFGTAALAGENLTVPERRGTLCPAAISRPPD
jgi:hypothetical protein